MGKRRENDIHKAETVIGGGEGEMPIGGFATAEVWQSILEGSKFSGIAMSVAHVIAMRQGSVLPSREDGSVQVTLSRIELVFVALNRNCELLSKDPEELNKRNEQRAQIIELAIQTASLPELMQIGKLLSENSHLCPDTETFAQLTGQIFDKLAEYEDEINEVVQSVSMRALMAGETEE